MAPKDQSWEKEEKKLARSLHALTVFRVAQAMPLVLSILRLYFEKHIKLKHAIVGIQLIENFTFQFNAITQSRGGGGISNMYARLAQDAWDCEDADDFQIVLKSMTEKFEDRLPTLDEFTLPFSQLIYRNDFTRNKDLVRYVLEKLQLEIGWSATTDFELLTVEHIISQSTGRRTEESDDCGAIGNLLLVSEALNSKLGSKAPSEKLTILKSANVPLGEVLNGSEKWTYSKVSARGGELAELGYQKIWNIS